MTGLPGVVYHAVDSRSLYGASQSFGVGTLLLLVALLVEWQVLRGVAARPASLAWARPPATPAPPVIDAAPPLAGELGSGARPTISVVVCAYTERRWNHLVEALESLRRQHRRPDETILVIDHNDALLDRARATFAEARVVPNAGPRGLSGARNTGVQHSRGELLAFMDDDAVAEFDWLEALLDGFSQPDVMGAGGEALPLWEGPQPDWMPPEFLWVVGASYEGLPRTRAPVRNPIGANMAFRREAFERAGGFIDGIGRVGRTPLGCEETEFSIRLRQVVSSAIVLHIPEARVWHRIPPDRVTWRYFMSRCWAEGLSKAIVTAHVGGEDALASERSYARSTLPLGFLRGLRAAVSGHGAGLARSGAIVVGLAVTAAGFARGRLAAAGSARRAGIP